VKHERYWTKTEYADFWKNKEDRATKQRNPLGKWWDVCGDDGVPLQAAPRDYWVEARRTEPESAAERRQTTRFGPHWVVDKARRPHGRPYTALQSPYDPENHFEGQRYGGAAHPLRFDIVVRQSWRTRILPALRSWAAEPPGLNDSWGRGPDRPHGPRPYELRWLQAIASRVITDRLGVSNDRYHSERLRDLKAHIRERRRESGAAAFQDDVKKHPAGFLAPYWERPRPALAAPKYARAVRWAELESIELYRRSDQLRWFVDMPVDDGCDNYADTTPACELNDARPLKGKIIPHGIDSQTAAFAGFEFQEVDNTIAERRARYGRPLRPRKKPGRKPNGECAMTGAERVANHRKKPS
jgi:hypothetical protein